MFTTFSTVSSMDLLNDENDEVLFNTASEYELISSLNTFLFPYSFWFLPSSERVSSAFSRGIAPEDSEEGNLF